MRRRRRAFERRRSSREPVLTPIDCRLLEKCSEGFDAFLRVTDRETRPPGEILYRRRAACGVVAGSQLRERLVALEWSRAWRPLFHQGVGELFSPPHPAAYHSVELRAHDQVGESLSAEWSDAGYQKLRKLGASQVLPAFQSALDHGVAAGVHFFVDLQLFVVRRHHRLYAWGSQLLHPANVAGGNEVPCRP